MGHYLFTLFRSIISDLTSSILKQEADIVLPLIWCYCDVQNAENVIALGIQIAGSKDNLVITDHRITGHGKEAIPQYFHGNILGGEWTIKQIK